MPNDPGHDEEANRRAFEAILADPKHDHPKDPNKPHAVDEEAVGHEPPWATDPKHPGPDKWHREPDPDSDEGFHWVQDK